MVETSKLTHGEVEFTHQWYRTFLNELRSHGYSFTPFSDYCGAEESIILRHDIDLSIEAAVELAQIEADLGAEATFFVLLSSPVYNPIEREERDRLRRIESLGHEVGLHFSTHEYWPISDPPAEEAIETRVREEFDIVGQLVEDPARAVSFHDPPEWVLDREFDAFESAYAPAYFSDMTYIADSGQRWRETPPNVPVPPRPTQLLSHPGLWGGEDNAFEACIEQWVSAACRRADRRARREILTGVTS